MIGLNHKRRWIVVVNRVEARIFDGRTMNLREVLVNELGREHNRALTTDKPGVSRSRFSGVSHVHALTGEKDPHEDVAVAFAKRIAVFLEKSMGLDKFDSLAIFAEPRMLGRLRSNFSKRLIAVIEFHPKDFGHLSVVELKTVIAKRHY